MNKHKTIVILMTLSLIVYSLAGCTEYRDVDDNGMFRLEFQEEVIEGKLYHPVSHDYLLTDWSMDNSFVSSSTQAIWGPLVMGDKVYVSCSVDEDDYDEAMGLTLFMFEHNDSYSWNLEDAILVISPESQNDSTDHIEYYGQLPQNLGEGLYTFVIMNDEMKIDSVFEYEVICPVDQVRKPVIYLYPQTDTDCYVSLDIQGYMTCTYPSYNADYGWHITAHPDGTITNLENGREYDYLFWEGECDIPVGFNNAICVRGCDTSQFLEEYLEAAGLTYSEIDDYISFWSPRMEGNPYNLISFPTEEYEEMAELTVNPTPDTMIRVYMVYMSLDEEVIIPEEQQLVMPERVERDGFVVVEWGGSEIESSSIGE